jgi:hypothetical protein
MRDDQPEAGEMRLRSRDEKGEIGGGWWMVNHQPISGWWTGGAFAPPVLI